MKTSTACPRNCYSSCSFYIHVQDNKVKNIDPHPKNLCTPEGVCLKGLAYIERANSSNRITEPLIKNKKNSTFEKTSWEEVLQVIADKIKFYHKEYGKHSILFYSASGMSGLVNQFSQKFWEMIGGATTTYGNLCWPAGLEATRLTLGENRHNAPWTLEHAKLIVYWGKNAAETNIQELIAVDKAIEKGAKVIVIDPRRTQTSEKANLHLQPKPGTDGALALAIAKILIKNNDIDKGFIDKHVKGYAEFVKSLENYSIGTLANEAGVKEDLVYEAANLIGSTKPMTIIPGYGMQRFSNGGQTIRCILTLSVLTGNIGKLGACWQYANLQSYVFDEVKEPLSYYPEKKKSVFRRTISMATLGEDILNTKEPQIKMAWIERGNPVSQNPDTNKVLNALRKLDFKVVVEQFMTDTALEADIVLPAKNMFEQSDIIGSYWNPYIQLKPKVVEPAGSVKPETEIYYLLAKELGFVEEDIKKHLPKPGNEFIEQFLKDSLAEHDELSFDKLREGPQLANSHEEITFQDYKFNTPSGKIELYSETAKKLWSVNELPTFVPPGYNESSYPLFLLSPNTKNRIHSQFNNLDVIKQFSQEPFVEIHPKEAVKRKIKDGDKVKVYNENGYFKLIAKVNFSIRRDCVSISNGWWIQEGGSTNFLSKGLETDMGYGAAFHDCKVEVVKLT